MEKEKCNCGKKAYKLINSNKIEKHKIIALGKKPICKHCYIELIKD